MTLESGLAFFIAILIFGVTPGPGVLAVLARALVNGARGCIFLSLGMAISDIVYLILACMGLAVVAQEWGNVFLVVRLTGAAYLIYMGYRLWMTPVTTQENTEKTAEAGKLASFIQVFLISASNPKVILFYIAFLPTFMDVTILSPADVLVASVLTLAGLMLGLMLIASGAAKAGGYVTSSRSMRRVNKISGSIMVGAGSFLALQS